MDVQAPAKHRYAAEHLPVPGMCLNEFITYDLFELQFCDWIGHAKQMAVGVQESGRTGLGAARGYGAGQINGTAVRGSNKGGQARFPRPLNRKAGLLICRENSSRKYENDDGYSLSASEFGLHCEFPLQWTRSEYSVRQAASAD